MSLRESNGAAAARLVRIRVRVRIRIFILSPSIKARRKTAFRAIAIKVPVTILSLTGIFASALRDIAMWQHSCLCDFG